MKQALTLAGGGAKGAYEIGAYRALDEIGFGFDIITGTSIGAVNGAMLVQGDEHTARDLWESLTLDQVMRNNGLSFSDSNSIEYYMEHKEALVPLLKNYITSKGVDITPFKEMLSTYLNEERFFHSPIDFGLMTVHFPTLSPEEITKAEIQPGYLEKWVLASASCFPAFPVCEIDGERYIDGMYYDNVPIDTAFRLGAEQVVAVVLRPGIAKNKYVRHPLVTYVEPSRPLGMALAFQNESITQNIQLGYYDTMKTFSKYYGNAYTFRKDDLDLEQYKKLAQKITRRIIRLEIFDTPEKQRLEKLLGDTAPLTEHLSSMQIASRQNDLTCFSSIAETYMDLFHYNVYALYSLPAVLKELMQRAAASDPEETMQTVLAAEQALDEQQPFEQLLRQFSSKELITALLLDELKL